MPRPIKLRIAAWCIFSIGALGSILAWRFEGAPDEMLQELNEPTKQSLYQLERMGGKMEVLMVEMHDWWLAQWRSPNLPYTILILTIASAGVMMLIAKLDERGGA